MKQTRFIIESLLIIDDDEHFSRVLQRSLEKQGITCYCANTTESALESAKTFVPNAIVLDLRLENQSGLSLIQPLLAVCPNARIVMLTGYASIPTAVDAIKQGAHNYLHKPATLSELFSAFEDQNDFESTEHDQVMSVDQMEWAHIQRVLNEHEGNISATARALNMHRRTLQRKLQKYAPK